MRLSFVSTIFLSTLALPFCMTADATAQSPALVLGPSKVETVASPLTSWQPRVEGETELTTGVADAKTSVVVEVLCVAVNLDCDVPLKSFFKPGSFEVHTGSMPSIDANSNVGVSRLSNASAALNSTTKMAAACESVRRAMPVMLAKLDKEGISKMKAALGSHKMTAAPNATCYSGQAATVSDMCLRPFVVGVKPIVGDDAVAHQPIIQTIEDGYIIQLTPVINDGKIDLNASLAHSTVSNVETFTFSGTQDAGVTVQIPEQTLKQVSVSTSLEDGETLFLDPRLQIEVDETQTSKLPFKKSKTVASTKQVYFLVTARIVVQAPEMHLTNAE